MGRCVYVRELWRSQDSFVGSVLSSTFSCVPGNELMPLCTTSIFAYHIISTAQSLDLLFCQRNSFSPNSILSRLLSSYCLLLTPLLKINYPQISLFLDISPSPMGQCVSILGLCCLGSYSF